MVGKMKAGQLDGAAVTAVGLSKIYKPILALQMPGLFTSWAKLDNARDVMKGEFEQGAKDAGFSILGWGDVGAAHVISKGFAVKSPDDIRGQKALHVARRRRGPGALPGHRRHHAGAAQRARGAAEPQHRRGQPAHRPRARRRAAPVVVEARHHRRGHGRPRHRRARAPSKRIDALPADLKTILTDTGKVAAAALTKRIRAEDDAAFARMKSKMTVVTLSADERAKWEAVFKQTRQRLAQGTFSPDLVAKLEGLAK